jgi:N-acetylglutamate synthase-like GNAT family acetyltransferase
MITPNAQARRATIEDLQKLMPLWEQAGLPAGELGKRLQEFQVLEDENGEMSGAIGLQIAGLEARLHHECFANAEEAEVVRAKLWERVQMISKNHGLARIWTQAAGPFWVQNGFQPAAPEVVSTLPPVFAGPGEPWSYVQLRENVTASPAIEKEFAIFKEMQLEERERAFSQARKMKVIALIAVLAVFALLVVWAALWLKTPLRPKP